MLVGDDDDGIAVVANSLALNGGTIGATDDATAATLDHAALTTTDHKVDIVVTLPSNLGQTAAGYQMTSVAVDVTVPSDTLELSIILTDAVDLRFLDDDDFS